MKDKLNENEPSIRDLKKQLREQKRNQRYYYIEL